MATYLPVFILWAFKTSEKVPSPFFEISLYSIVKTKELVNIASLDSLNSFVIILTVHSYMFYLVVEGGWEIVIKWEWFSFNNGDLEKTIF